MKDRVFRDPVHGLVGFKGDDAPLQTLLATRAMQRLRRIRQMGFAWLVYPGAEHSRFGHALGAYWMAARIVTALDIEAPVARHIKVAALVHDIGHGPFSHAWEEALHGPSHEEWGRRLVREDAELSAALAAIEPGLPATMSAFWDKTYQPAYARKLVSSQLDVDRLDYLLRDGHYSGAGYATFDPDWLLHAMRIEPVRGEDSDPHDLVIDYRRGRLAVEQYLFARSHMYAQVYHHKTVRAAEWMFLKLMQRYAELARAAREPAGLSPAAALARGERIDTRDYLWLDDLRVQAAMSDWAGHGLGDAAADPVIRDLAARLVERRLFKTLELGSDPSVVETLRPALEQAARDRFGAEASYYGAIDSAEQIAYKTSDRASHGKEELYVVGHPSRGTVALGDLLADVARSEPTPTLRLVCAEELVERLRPTVRAALDVTPPA